MKQSISEFDRLQALFRTQQFRDDILRIREDRNYQRRENLKDIFLEKYIIHFKDVEFLLNHYSFIPDIKGISVISEELSEPDIKGLCDFILNSSAVTMLNKISADHHFKTASLSSGKYISHGKYVAVLVDLSQKKTKILSDFKSCVDSNVLHVTTNSRYWEETRGKEKDFQYSIWRVYDLCSQKKKPNFTEVARMLSGKSGQARDNADLAACLKAVKRAYKQACEIIKKVDV